MRLDVNVFLLPSLVVPKRLAGSTAIVVDVLRASTTIVHALARGARAVIPTLEVDDALAVASRCEPETFYLGGERHGELIPGFHFDNSPYSYTREKIHDRTIIFTTTNGTRALLESAAAETILIGAMANLTAVAKTAVRLARPIHVVCAGTNGKLSNDDLLTAGAIVSKIGSLARRGCKLTYSARLAQKFFEPHSESQQSLLHVFSESLGGRNLKELGFDADIKRCAERDLFYVVPVFDPQTGEITRMQ